VKIIDYYLKDWGKEEFIEGLYSAPGIGYDVEQVEILGKDIKGRVYFCGEAYTPTNRATIHGAYETALEVSSTIEDLID
jgi:monoamine oxidase